jgi:hypothetical protein
MALDVSPNGQGYLRFSFKIHPEMGRIGNGEMDGDRGKGEPTQEAFLHTGSASVHAVVTCRDTVAHIEEKTRFGL